MLLLLFFFYKRDYKPDLAELFTLTYSMPARKGKTGRAREKEREGEGVWVGVAYAYTEQTPGQPNYSSVCVFVCVAHGEVERIQNRKETNWELGKKAKQNEGSSNFSNEIMHS